MTTKRHPGEAEFTMLDAAFSKNPEDWDNWVRAQGLQPDPDLPVCLASFPPEAWVDCCKVLPTPAVQRYLDSGDTLTNHAIDMMELALERDYGVSAPWCVVSHRKGREADGTLAVDYFYLLQER